MPVPSQSELIADEIGRALRGEAWHGPSVLELLDGVSADEAMQRPIASAHTIWELVLHITAWSNIALRRITGGQAEPYMDEDWPLPGDFSAERWAAAREELTESHDRLREIIISLSDARLAENAPKSRNTIALMLHGVAQHAAYHGGQIAILKKAVTPYPRRVAL